MTPCHFTVGDLYVERYHFHFSHHRDHDFFGSTNLLPPQVLVIQYFQIVYSLCSYLSLKTMPAPEGHRITIRLPDDFHHHCRDGLKTTHILGHATKRFGRCLMMPNLKPPVTNAEMAMQYKEHILKSMPDQDGPSSFEPLMTLYLTDKTTAEDIDEAAKVGVVGCKYYPAGATTNSDSGVTDIKNCYPALEALRKHNMMLCIHSEVTHADIFEREPIFIEEIMKPLVSDFPGLKITMEHISTKDAVEYVKSAPDHVKASITCHHLVYNRNGT